MNAHSSPGSPQDRSGNEAQPLRLSQRCGLWLAVVVALVAAVLFLNDKDALWDFYRRASTAWLRDTVIVAVVCMAVGAGAATVTSNVRGTRRVFGGLAACAVPLAWWSLGGWPRFAELWAGFDEHRSVTGVIVVVGAAIGLRCGARWFGGVAAPWLWRVSGLLAGAALITAANAWAQVGTVAWLLLLASAVGAVLAALLGASGTNVPQVLRVALGLVTLAMSTLLLGLLGFVSPAILITALVLTSLLLWRQLLASAARIVAAWQASNAPVTVLATTMHAAFAAVLSIYLVAALGPETGNDALGFRLAAPLHWSADGAIAAIPQMLASYGVFLAEMLSLLGLPLAGPSIIRLVQFGVVLVLLHSAVHDVLGERTRARAAMWLFPFFASSMVWWQFASGFNDVVQLLFVHGALLSVARWRKQQATWWLWSAGICAGAAAATKLNGAFAVVLVAVLVVLPAGRGFRVRELVAAGMRAGAGFVLVFAPWALRSFWLTGNPLFPYANRVFNSPMGLPVPREWPYGVGTDLGSLAQIPLLLFTEPRRFVELGTFHPAMLILMPLAIAGLVFAFRRGRFWCAATLLAAFLWAFSMQNMRYGILVAWCATLTMAIGLEQLHSRLRGTASRALLVAAVSVSLLGFSLQHLHPIAWMWTRCSGSGFPTEVVFGSVPADDYLTQHLRAYAAAKFLNAQVGKDAHLLQVPPYLADHASFRARVTAYPHAIQQALQPLQEIVYDADAKHEDVHAAMVRAGFTHMMYAGYANSVGPLFTEEFAARYLQPIHANADVRLFAVEPEARAKPKQLIELVAAPSKARVRIPVEPSALYIMRITLAEATDDKVMIAMRWFGADGKFLKNNVVMEGSRTRDYYQTAPAGAHEVDFHFAAGASSAVQVELLRVRAPNSK